MSDCGVCLSHDVVGHSEFYNSETRKARKQHKCCECGRSISPGDEYIVSSGKYEGEFFSVKTCATCDEILRAFSCGGGCLHECLWDDMHDYVFPELTTGCLEKLTTAAAKQYLMERWREWKGFQ